MAAVKKITSLDLEGKLIKGGRNTEENYIKNGVKGFKNASFWVTPLFAGGKMTLKGGRGIIEVHNIYPCFGWISKNMVILIRPQHVGGKKILPPEFSEG